MRDKRATVADDSNVDGMTMYDFVRCEWPLPEASFQHNLFETESLGSQGRHYTITKEGRLLRRLSEEVREYKGPHYTGDAELPIDGEVRLSSRWRSPEEPRLSVVFRFREGLVEWVKRQSDVDSLHKLLAQACKDLPGDYKPWGELDRDDPKAPQGWWADCSCGCRHYLELRDAGDQHISNDWGVCINPKSHRCGLLTFEHQGCPAFQYEDEDDK